MYKCLLAMCLITILLVPASAMADQISGDQVKQECENYRVQSDEWKAGCGFYVQGNMPFSDMPTCRQSCLQLLTACQAKCRSAYGVTPQLGGCNTACIYAANRCSEKCKPGKQGGSSY
jgi:hypothetical protein